MRPPYPPLGEVTDCESNPCKEFGPQQVAGWADVRSGGRQFALARYNPDGSLDTSFDRDGRVLTNIGSGDDFAHALAIDSDGRIVAAGGSTRHNGTMVVARYNTNGTLDRHFHKDGKVRINFRSSRNEIAKSVAIDERGRIVVAGEVVRSNRSQFALARLRTDGNLDRDFGRRGRVLTNFSYSAGARAISIDDSGRIVAAGYFTFGTVTGKYSWAQFNNQLATARYNPDGSLDRTFGSGGTLLTNFVSTLREEGNAIAIDNSGTIFVAGWAEEPRVTLIPVGTAGVAASRVSDESSDTDAREVGAFTPASIRRTGERSWKASSHGIQVDISRLITSGGRRQQITVTAHYTDVDGRSRRSPPFQWTLVNDGVEYLPSIQFSPDGSVVGIHLNKPSGRKVTFFDFTIGKPIVSNVDIGRNDSFFMAEDNKLQIRSKGIIRHEWQYNGRSWIQTR